MALTGERMIYMPNKTLYISDLDGTLLDKTGRLTAHAADALNTMIENGLNFTIATARAMGTAGIILKDLNLTIPIVLMNGVVIYDILRKNYVKINVITPDAVAAVVDAQRELKITGIMRKIVDNEVISYYESTEQKMLRDFIDERRSIYNMPFVHTESFHDIKPENIIYFGIIDTQARLQLVCDALSDRTDINFSLYEDVYNPGQWFLEISSAEASKKQAIEYLKTAYGYNQVICFGDNYNDLPMFEASDIRIAVANAKPEVLAAASHICAPNHEDGVVKWLLENAVTTA